MLTVRVAKEEDPHGPLYDEDLPEHGILVWDWTHTPAANKFLAHHHAGDDNKADSVLINGKGAARRFPSPDGVPVFTPREVFTVSKVCDSIKNREAKVTKFNFLFIIFVSRSLSHLQKKKKTLSFPFSAPLLHEMLNPHISPSCPVAQGLRYRFRLVNAGFLNCPLELSIDNHTLLVVASDGADVKPVRGT